MAVKSIIDIEINDDAFKRFRELFSQYQAELKAQPGAWGAVNDEIAGAAEGFAGMTAALLAQRELYHEEEQALKRQNAEQKRLLDTERARGREMLQIWDTTKRIAAGVASTTVELFKWAGVGTIIGGLAGAGGLWGLDSVARSVGNTRRTALGLGVSPGELEASRVSFGSWIDAQGSLQALADAKSDAGKQWAFGATGVNRGLSGIDLQEQLFQRARAYAQTTDPRILANTAQTKAFGELGISVDDLRALARMDKQDLELHAATLANAKRNIDLSNATARQWQYMDTVLQTSRLTIENAFIKGLAPLTPQLAKLSEAVAGVFLAFARNKDVKVWIDQFAAGIGEVAKWVGSPQFKTDIESFADKVAKVTEGLVNALKYLDLIPDSSKPATSDGGASPFQKSAVGRGAALLDPRGSFWGNFNAFLAPDANARLAHSMMRENNVGNLRTEKGGFAGFATKEQGVLAMAEQLNRYHDLAKWGHADTLRKLITTYEGGPANRDHNNIAAYIDHVSKWTGIGADEKIDTHDLRTMIALIVAMVRQEGHHVDTATVGRALGGVHIKVTAPSGSSVHQIANQGVQ